MPLVNFMRQHCDLTALLQQLKQKFSDQPITIVLDNARYQRNAFVFEEAAKLGIQLLFLLAYSPNLNLIERLWKFVKAECLNSRYYETFPQFCHAIETCVTQPTDDQKARLKTLLTVNFQRSPRRANVSPPWRLPIPFPDHVLALM